MSEAERVASHILDMCQRVEREFTLREIVARVLMEKREMIVDFPEAWGLLIRTKRITLCKTGDVSTYRLTTSESA